MQQQIILASASPRRQEMLQNLGLEFTIHPSGADETVVGRVEPSDLVEMLAVRKAADVASSYQSGIVIGSDTVVAHKGQALGKPVDDQEAFQMLSSLQGQTHSVFSGLAVINAKNGVCQQGWVETKVHMRPVSEEEIRDYILTGEPRDKAGAYAIQGFGSLFVNGIEGDYFSVVGMPIRLLAQYLEQFGVNVLKQVHQRHTRKHRE
ncbi:septum formation protein Maf [Ammoniphilus oxalaticus]|uniref:dTTP/UTP pyrophosphatase n=2 Tax=Ammoniphilus oxalaticus TaxID=66863 RepID=A0A419SL69_9BACL|nr:septum formation protein Maf [Ammoniphilus oxalaticus]